MTSCLITLSSFHQCCVGTQALIHLFIHDFMPSFGHNVASQAIFWLQGLQRLHWLQVYRLQVTLAT